MLATVLLLGFLALACSRSQNEVVVYASQDQVFAEPLFEEFTRQTGIKVRALFDSEAVKGVGITQRLMQERSRPQCDVFWNNEELRTRQLAAQGVFREQNSWAAFGYRSRRVVINTNRVSLAQAPRSLLELTNAAWRGKVALAYPLFGSTSTHFLALRQSWGETKWRAWCQALQANKPFLVDGNSLVVQLVGRGEAWSGLTDSDDIEAGIGNRLPIQGLPLSPESLLIPNTVGVIRNAPHPGNAQKLFAYLQSGPVLEQLVEARALEGPWEKGFQLPQLKPDWGKLVSDAPNMAGELSRIFLR